MTAKRTSRPPLKLTEDLRIKLEELRVSASAHPRRVMRARILLLYAQGRSIAAIHEALGVSRPTIYKCIDRAIAGGVLAGLEDHVPTAQSAPLSDDARKWFVGLACTMPRQLGMDRDHWTFSGLVAHIQEHATGAGYPELVRASRSTLWRMLNHHHLTAQPTRWFLERRTGPASPGSCGQEVLLLRHRLALVQVCVKGPDHRLLCLSLKKANGRGMDGKIRGSRPRPGLQHEITGRLHLLTALDLRSCEVLVRVEAHYRIREFITLLQTLDAHFPAENMIRLVLDRHPAHLALETMTYLESRTGRFEYLLNPGAGSWLNLIQDLYGKLVQAVCDQVRAPGQEELQDRLLARLGEINWRPIVCQWERSDLGLADIVNTP